mgnify:CR=1 FL=1
MNIGDLVICKETLWFSRPSDWDLIGIIIEILWGEDGLLYEVIISKNGSYTILRFEEEQIKLIK